MQTVAQWLGQLGLAQYAEAFERNAVDFAIAKDLTQQDMRDLGVEALGHRKILLRAIAELNATQAIASQAQGEDGCIPSERSLRTEVERRQLTVMFCDLVGSTALAQKLDPEELRDLMQAYQRACGEVIAQYDGHVAQYLGDGLMVYFGWPRAHEDGAARAIRASLEVTQAVSSLRASVPLAARIGIHTGLVVVGETGHGDASVPKAAVGETPNIAARLQSLAEPGSVVVSERTSALARGMFDYTDLGLHTLKGIAEPMRLLRVSAARAIESRFDAARSELALTPLVGREEEIALLMRRWQQARDGEGQVVLVGGEPGIGKSRLTRVLRERLSQERHVVLRYQCSPYHVNSAFYSVIDQFERAAGFTRDDSPEQKLDKTEAMLAGSSEHVAASAPLFAALLSLPTERYQALTLSPQKQKEKTLEALASQVEALAQRQPLLMIYEDVHWIDATSQEAIDLLVPRLRDLPVLMIVTYRPEYSPRWTDQAHVTTLGLNRLARRQGKELLAKLTDDKPLPQEVVDQILAHADGVPLFIEELTKSVLESKLLRRENDGYVLDAPVAALAIPTTLRDSLIARLDRLAPLREVAQIGACIGREFSYELLAAVSPLKGDGLSEALDQLSNTGLVFRRGTPPSATYTFKHALVQDAAYDSLLKAKRVQLHAQIAQALENLSDVATSQPEILARHYTAAGPANVAIPLWHRAGKIAVQRFALKEAIAHLQQGLAIVETLPAGPERNLNALELRTALGPALVALRGWATPEVGHTLRPAATLATSLRLKQNYLPVLYGLWVHYLTQGHLAESMKWAEELLTAADASKDGDLEICGHRAAMTSHFWMGNLVAAQRHGDIIKARYDIQGHWHIASLTNSDPLTAEGLYGSLCLWMLGYPDQAVKVSETKDEHARCRGHPFDLGFALTLGAHVFDYRCEPQSMLVRVEEAERLGREHDVPFMSEVMAQIMKGVAWLRAEKVSESVGLLRDSLDRLRAMGHGLWIPYLKAVMAEATARAGDIEAALSIIDNALAQVEEQGERVGMAETLRLKGWMLEQQGKLEQAERYLLAAVEVSLEQQAKSWQLRSAVSLARVWQRLGRRTEARDLLAPIYDWFTEGFDTKDLKEAKALLKDLS